jgi:hypothetical protein
MPFSRLGSDQIRLARRQPEPAAPPFADLRELALASHEIGRVQEQVDELTAQPPIRERQPLVGNRGLSQVLRPDVRHGAQRFVDAPGDLAAREPLRAPGNDADGADGFRLVVGVKDAQHGVYVHQIGPQLLCRLFHHGDAPGDLRPLVAEPVYGYRIGIGQWELVRHPGILAGWRRRTD